MLVVLGENGGYLAKFDAPNIVSIYSRFLRHGKTGLPKLIRRTVEDLERKFLTPIQ